MEKKEVKKYDTQFRKEQLRRNGKYYIDGKTYPSVTEIISVIEKPALRYWYASTVARYMFENPEVDNVEEAISNSVYSKRDKAADKGSMIHSLVEAISKGHEPADEYLSEENKPYAEAFLSFWDTHKPKIIKTECVVVNDTEEYAGTTDLICKIEDVIYLIDYKTGKGIYPKELSLQLSAYKNAEYIYNKQTKEKIPLPKIDKIAGVHLKPDGTFSFVEVEDNFEVFLATKKLWIYQNEE